MSIKGVITGILLALFISAFTYFNDAIVRGTFLIGNHLPLGIFGIVIIFLLLLNPVLRAINRKWPLTAGELAVATGIGLAACAWPGSNFYRVATGSFTMPVHREKTVAAWRAQNVLSYVPGGSPLLAQGHVSDWNELAQEIYGADETGYGPAERINEMLESHYVRAFEEAAQRPTPYPSHIDTMTRGINSVLESRQFYDEEAFAEVEIKELASRLLKEGIDEISSYQLQRLNRSLLVSAFPDLVFPPPPGGGVLLSMDEGGEMVLDTLLEGRAEDDRLSLREIPWGVWLPNIFLWGGLAVILGLASLCLALIVHPQWSKRELLSYPIARFMDAATKRDVNSYLPDIAYNKHFWVALAVILGIRLLNGMATWFDGVPEFPLIYSFDALRELFPTARQVPQVFWDIRIYPTVIAFAFFLNTKISFSLGISFFAWVFFISIFIARGVAFTQPMMGSGQSQLLRFGGYIGMAMVMCYTGRHYYKNVIASTFGFSRAKETPAYAVWASRGLLACIVIAIYLMKTAGLPLFWGVLCVLIILLTFLVMSRIVSETGAFFIQSWWLPVGMLTGLFGVEAIGPTPYIVLAMISIMMLGDPRTTLMPYLNTALRMGEETADARPSRLTPWLAGIIVVSFVVAGAATLYFQHNEGINLHDRWATHNLPSMPFSELSSHTSEMSATGVLTESTSRSTLERLALFNPKEGVYIWVLLGLAFVLITAFARLRLPWWPIHPVLFLVWGTYPIQMFNFSFLIGCMIKAGVIKTLGAKGYHRVQPIMIGLIGGDLLGGFLWIVVGVIYYFVTGYAPESYTVFPG